jgi:flagellar hook-associated protein 2
MALSLSGLASGVDWTTLVDQLTELERAPQAALRREQTTLASRSSAYGALITELLALQTKAQALTASGLFQQRRAEVDNFSAATASAAAGTTPGTYTFAFSQLATAAKQVGAANIGARLSASSDVSGVVLSSAPLATAVTAGTFTVNGAVVTVETSDSLQDVFTKISTATGGAVTASYDSGTDKITLSSAAAIVLGSAGDTSNFLQVARLTQNGTGTVTSALALGVVQAGAVLNAANFTTAVSGSGEFQINGVSLTYDAATDTLTDVLARITNSAAGVTAQYDPVNDQVILTNKTTGNVGIALQDLTGNFLAATGLLTSSGGSLTAGTDLEYTVNGGPTLTSRSNTATAESHGITGLSVTALSGATTTTPATATVTVGSDTAGIRTAIEDLITQYNKVQSLIETYTASSTDSDGVVTAGVLAGDRDITSLASELRQTLYGPISALTGSITQLAQLGYTTNGNDDQITLGDSATLDSILAGDLADLETFFADSTAGLAATLSNYLERQAGDDGYLLTRQSTFTTQSTRIDEQIAALERTVQSNRERLIASFLAMERAQAQINQQLQFLQSRFGGSATS